jgi:DeoR/GlpR family transcriptional regulator of sugar metabolism
MGKKDSSKMTNHQINWEDAQRVLDNTLKQLPNFDEIGYTAQQAKLHTKDKEAIAIWTVQYLANLYKMGLSIFLDSGTTVQKVAQYLLKAIAVKELIGVSILTNSLLVRDELSRWSEHFRFKLVNSGGETDDSHKADWGTGTVNMMKSYNYHAVIIGTSGISFQCKEGQSENSGLTVHGGTPEEITKKAFMQKETDYRIIVAGYNKIGSTDFKTCCQPDKFLEGVRRKCLIVTTPPPEDDEVSKRRFEEEVVAFEELCRKLNGIYAEERVLSPGAARELKLVVVDPESGEEIETMSRSSIKIGELMETDYLDERKKDYVAAPTTESFPGLAASEPEE